MTGKFKDIVINGEKSFMSKIFQTKRAATAWERRTGKDRKESRIFKYSTPGSKYYVYLVYLSHSKK